MIIIIVRSYVKVGERGQYNYDEAIAACAGIGSTLATIITQADVESLKSVPGIEGIRGNGNPVWIGLNDRAVEGTYEWQDGTV